MKTSRPTRGFTLLEILVVLAIMAVVAAMVTPAVSSTLQAHNLTQGTQTLLAQLSQARQIATSKNRVVETRFYRFVDPEFKEAQSRFHAMQNFELQDDGRAVPLDRVQRLPQGVILDSGTSLSPLLGAARAKQWTAADPQISLPGVGTSYDACVVRMRPDGSTDLPATLQPWFLTLHHENKGDNLSDLPPNFSMVQINSWTGQTVLYRP